MSSSNVILKFFIWVENYCCSCFIEKSNPYELLSATEIQLRDQKLWSFSMDEKWEGNTENTWKSRKHHGPVWWGHHTASIITTQLLMFYIEPCLYDYLYRMHSCQGTFNFIWPKQRMYTSRLLCFVELAWPKPDLAEHCDRTCESYSSACSRSDSRYGEELI